MSTSAKVTIIEQDRSNIVPTTSGIGTGIVIVSDKGVVNKPTLCTSLSQFQSEFGMPNPSLGTSYYSAQNYFNQGNKLWVVRSTHNDSKYSAALVRSKISPLPTEFGAPFQRTSLIVDPIDNGLTQSEFDNYQFQSYLTNRVYEDTGFLVSKEYLNSGKLLLDRDSTGFKIGDQLSFSTKTLEELNNPKDNVGESELVYTVTQVNSTKVTLEKILLETPVNVIEGTVIKKIDPKTGDEVDITGSPIVLKTISDSREVLVSNTDYIHDGDELIFIPPEGAKVVDETELPESPETEEVDPGFSVDPDKDGSIPLEPIQPIVPKPVKAKFISKSNYDQRGTELILDIPFTSVPEAKVYRILESDLEDRDSFLVLATSQGKWSTDISIGITPSTNYENGFNILVYDDGVLAESWEVTKLPMKDGFGNQLEIEQKINGSSDYIQVKSNPNNNNIPLNTDYSLWQRSSRDIFIDSRDLLKEDLLKGHVEVKLDNVSDLEMGKRVKFVIGASSDSNSLSVEDGFQLSKEYKVLEVHSEDRVIILDRPIEEDSIPSKWVDPKGETHETRLYLFDPTNNDPESGIINGIKYYRISRINKVYYNYPLNSNFSIDGLSGKLLSGGVNLLTGGSSGSTVTIGDLIESLQYLGNQESTQCSLIMDGGIANVAYAKAILTLVNKNNLSHGFLSVPLSAEDSTDPVSAVIAYRNQLGVSDPHVSLFSGWIKFFDSINQIYPWTSPESYAVVSQSYTTNTAAMFYPAAGWTRGRLSSGLEVKVKYSESQRDQLVESQINPIRFKANLGLAIWGNETLYTKPSPLQLRSIAMLLIVIKQGLLDMLEYKTFEFNNEYTWKQCQGTINAFMRDQIKAKGGVYDYKLSIKEVTTKTDIDNRRMNVFLGIQPTMDINLIPVTLAIYNSSIDISVDL